MSNVETPAAATGGVRIEMRGATPVITLDRAAALNALTVEMRAQLAAAYPRFARDPQVYAVIQQSACPKAFCAGGDVREMLALKAHDPAAARRAFADEYRLNWLHDCFSKPTLSLIDGMVMGSGVGITAYGTHRIAGEGYRFAMPEVAIGLFPDVGVAHLLSRLPHSAGIYLALTGRSIGRADAYAFGLVTHCIPRARFDEIRTAVADADPVDPVLDTRHVEPGRGELTEKLEEIDRFFSGATIEEIVARLHGAAGPHKAFADDVLADLGKRSPISLKITHRHVREARERDLRQTLLIDYRLACRCLDGPDFIEGVRATLIDKDGRPQWRPDRLEDVSEAMVDAYFAPLGAGDLALPTRQEMQEARV